MPKYQGQLDGLCGPYAIANALEFCLGVNSKESFEVCCRSVAPGRWPDLLWDGTGFGDLERMLKACREYFKLAEVLRNAFPFKRDVPKTNANYWKRFDEVMSGEGVKCALIGMNNPAHWILATGHRSGILFLDSTANETLALRSRDQLFAGERRPAENVWLINRRELATFEILERK